MTRIWNKFTLLDTKLSNRAGKLNSVRNSRLSNGAGTPLKPRRRNEVSLRGRRKVFVGMSGGVDSSVSAALLKKDGYDVTGVFIKVWNPVSERLNLKSGKRFNLFSSCQAVEDRLDAMRVCAKLGIPFVTVDLSKEYKKEVVDYMIREYKAGKTPNPDVFCNRFIKFGAFYEWARAQGADFVATGHYARVASDATREARNPKSEIRNKSQIQDPKLQTANYKLLTGSDPNKDQSYFLWQIRQEQLPHILFPVGGMLKPEVRKLAKKFGLSTADKKDSQGLCFLGKIDVKGFLKNYIKPKSGKVLNEKGEEIGWHDGAMFLTIGERHGFSVTRINADIKDADKRGRKNVEAKPYYVITKDIKKNTLTVSHDPKMSVHGDSRTVFEIGEVNWFGPAPVTGTGLFARLRYRQPLQKVRITNQESRIMVKIKSHRSISSLIPNSKFIIQFASAQTGGATGQSIVFYDGEVCLGGGIIGN